MNEENTQKPVDEIEETLALVTTAVGRFTKITAVGFVFVVLGVLFVTRLFEGLAYALAGALIALGLVLVFLNWLERSRRSLTEETRDA